MFGFDLNKKRVPTVIFIEKERPAERSALIKPLPCLEDEVHHSSPVAWLECFIELIN